MALDPRNGQRARDGLVAELQPERRREPTSARSSGSRADCTPASPLLNRATAGPLPAGLDVQGRDRRRPRSSRSKYTPDSTFVDPGYCTVYGKRVNNFDTERPVRHRSRSRRRCSTRSTRSSATSAWSSAPSAILKQAKKFGFYEPPPLETPDERAARRAASTATASCSTRSATSDVDAGRMAFGQERLLVTPLQMAMVAGDDRQRRHPDAALRRRRSIVSPGRQDARRDEADDDPPRRSRPATAAAISATMMVRRRPGAAPAPQRRSPGLRIGGKTGTAETGVDGSNTTWFIAFAGRRRHEAAARDRRRAPEPVAHGRRDGRADRAAGHAGTPAPDGESLTYGDPWPRDDHHRAHLRRPLPPRAQARLGRDGGRLARRGPGARTPRRGQDPARALRERRAVRRALPPRGDARGRALAPEHRLDLRPRRLPTARTSS